MSHEFKRQTSTNQMSVLFTIRILHENWEEGKSKLLYLLPHIIAFIQKLATESPQHGHWSKAWFLRAFCSSERGSIIHSEREVQTAAYLHCRG